MWMLPLYLHVNQKSDYDDMMTADKLIRTFSSKIMVHALGSCLQAKNKICASIKVNTL